MSFLALSDGGLLTFFMFIFEKIRQAGNLKCDVQVTRENDSKQEIVGVFLNFGRGGEGRLPLGCLDNFGHFLWLTSNKRLDRLNIQ